MLPTLTKVIESEAENKRSTTLQTWPFDYSRHEAREGSDIIEMMSRRCPPLPASFPCSCVARPIGSHLASKNTRARASGCVSVGLFHAKRIVFRLSRENIRLCATWRMTRRYRLGRDSCSRIVNEGRRRVSSVIANIHTFHTRAHATRLGKF